MREFIRNVLEREARSLAFLDEVAGAAGLSRSRVGPLPGTALAQACGRPQRPGRHPADRPCHGRSAPSWSPS